MAYQSRVPCECRVGHVDGTECRQGATRSLKSVKRMVIPPVKLKNEHQKANTNPSIAIRQVHKMFPFHQKLFARQQLDRTTNALHRGFSSRLNDISCLVNWVMETVYGTTAGFARCDLEREEKLARAALLTRVHPCTLRLVPE